MSDPFIGQIMPVGWSFAARGWTKCDGQLLQISQNTALFSLLGTTYGGDGRTTFGLPDLRGRVAIHQGQGPGLSSYAIGQKGGTEQVTLAVNQMPSHSHTVNSNTNPGNLTNPANAFPASETVGTQDIYSDTSNSTMNPAMIANSGGSQAHTNLQPYLTINWLIALVGIFPSRN